MATLVMEPGEFIRRLRIAALDPFVLQREESGRPRNAAAAVRELCERELTAKQRQALELCVFDGMSVTQAAAQLGVNKSTVSRHIRSARKRLEKAVRYASYPLVDR